MKLTRRQALLGGTAAVLAVPAVMQARWLATDHARPGFSPRPPAAPEGRRLWRNWSGLHHAAPSEIFSAQTEADLAARIATATGRVRPMGSGHAFIDLVPTDDMMVDVSRLSGLIEADPATRIARFGAGTRLRQAAMLADEAGLAFPNLPDIDVQTLAGSYATATHGTGRDLTALHGRITGFRLITPDGSTHDVTRASDPDLFDAGRVSMGALGVMSRFDVELVDRFALTRKMFLIPTEQAIETMHDQARSHHYHEFYVLPHTGYAAVITHDLHDGPVAGRAPSRDEDFIATFRTLRDVLGWWPWARRKAFEAYVLAQNFPDGLVENETDLSWKLLSTARVTRMNEMEYHLPEATATDALRQAIAIVESDPASFFPMEVRFTGADDAWLSPFNDGPRCSIAVHCAQDEPYDVLFDQIEPMMRAHGGRPHWGKLHSLGARDLADLYPRFGDFLALRRRLDPTGKFLNRRTADLFGEAFPA